MPRSLPTHSMATRFVPVRYQRYFSTAANNQKLSEAMKKLDAKLGRVGGDDVKTAPQKNDAEIVTPEDMSNVIQNKFAQSLESASSTQPTKAADNAELQQAGASTSNKSEVKVPPFPMPQYLAQKLGLEQEESEPSPEEQALMNKLQQVLLKMGPEGDRVLKALQDAYLEVAMDESISKNSPDAVQAMVQKISEVTDKHLKKNVKPDALQKFASALGPELAALYSGGQSSQSGAELETKIEVSAKVKVSSTTTTTVEMTLPQQSQPDVSPDKPEISAPAPVPSWEEPVTESELIASDNFEQEQHQNAKHNEIRLAAKLRLDAAVQAIQLGEYDKAVSACEDCLRALRDMNDLFALPMVYPMMFDALTKDGKTERARVMMQEALQLFANQLSNINKEYAQYFNPTSTTTTNRKSVAEKLNISRKRHNLVTMMGLIAGTLQQGSHYEAALEWWRKIYQEVPDASTPYVPLIDCLLRVRRSLDESKQNAEGKKLSAEETERLIALGRRIQQVSDELTAIVDDAMVRFPENTEIQLACAKTYIWKGKLDEALDIYTKIATANPKEGLPYLNRLANSYLQKMDFARAETIARKVLQIQENNQAAHSIIARIYKQRGDMVKAMEHLELAAEGDVKMLTAAGYELGLQSPNPSDSDTARAIKLLKKALEIDPKDVDALLTLAAVYGRLKEWEEAVKHLDTVLEINPNHDQAKKIRSFFSERLHPTQKKE